ncbi:MAG: hypothetical protein H0W78_00935 [Planctomycetes bacterium]|nr:hypothetical protein [Planctomycetota bacterium]
MSPLRWLSLLLLVSVLVAGEAPKPSPAPGTTPTQPEKAAPKTKKSDPFSQLAEEEKWTFDPPINRQDIFYDLEAMLMSQLGTELVKSPGIRPGGPSDDIAGLRQWAKEELARVESFIFERKWDDALKATEADLKKLQPRVGEDAIIAQITEKLKRYRAQAEEAKIFEEAQAKFDALGLRVEGILWSPAGSLAVISGEPRARAINERVKDCVIINIDTNRVDFLFHYNRRRFEFQRYVGEDVTAKKPGQTK